jgi:rubrerythrin
MKTIAIALCALLPLLAASNASALTSAEKKTATDLKAAITGETTASAKYAAYAGKAREEGHVKVALLFEAASRAEAIHAENHRSALAGLGEKLGDVKPKFTVGTTQKNLEDAIKGESYESATMYPKFINAAKAAKADAAVRSFDAAFKAEQKHKVMYEKALAALKTKTVNDLPSQYFVCPTCGDTYDSQAPEACNICGVPKERFVVFK